MTMSFWQLLSDHRITIPILQRDYVQGQTIGKAPSVRENLLNTICTSLQYGKPKLELDFIYGYTEVWEEPSIAMTKIFYPLDGQQRLTTLFLFHWYIAAKEGFLDDAVKSQLAKFSYHTRPGSRDFCARLSTYQPEDFTISIKRTIINQPWFFAAWINDPTISSMLVMLDAIQSKLIQFSIEQVWTALVSDSAPIVFHVLRMEDLGLPDELYIKMNSRGKALTDFEYFKARFSEFLTPNQSAYFNRRIDQAWSDLFWDRLKEKNTRDIAQLVDASIMRFIRYITDLIAAREQIKTISIDEFARYRTVYGNPHNTDFLFEVMDNFVDLYKNDSDFFSRYFYLHNQNYVLDHTKLFFERQSPDLFQNCITQYNPNGKINPFPIIEQLLLYACIIHKKHKTTDFAVRIRQLRNLLSNSEDTLRADNLMLLIESVERIVINADFDEHTALNTTQIEDELRKMQFIDQYPQLREPMERLEDHQLLQGCLSIIELTPDLADDSAQFLRLFHHNCDYEQLSCAMLTQGDYSQYYRHRRRFGNKNWTVWRDLFLPSRRRSDYDKTQIVLRKLINLLKSDSSLTDKEIIKNWLDQFESNPMMERDWRYYYIKYAEFRKHEKGYYIWPDESKLYESFMILSIEIGGKNWDPINIAIQNNLSHKVYLGNYSSPLFLNHGPSLIKIYNKNEEFSLEADDSESQALLEKAVASGLINDQYTCPVQQSDNRLDIQDRVQVGVKLIENLKEL